MVSKVKFNNGYEIPAIGLGTWMSKHDEVGQAVKYAIDIGYRHIDCAYVYENEKEVGAAIAEKIAEGVVKREDLFITSKLWNTFHRPASVEPALKKSLENLGLDYLDLYLIHWPMGFKEGDDLIPMGPNGLETSDYDYVNTWKVMEEINKKGLALSIGVSNFNKRQIERILETGTIVPVTNQVESHPFLNQQKLKEYCNSKGITIIAYSPLGSPGQQWVDPNSPKPLKDPKIKEIGNKYNKTPAQILIKYQVQRGNVTIPKSVHKTRIQENFDVFDFELSSEDMNALDSLNCNCRVTTFLPTRYHKYYPFKDEY